MGNRYLVVDLETTGVDHLRDEIIEIGVVTVEDEKIVDTWQTLVRPVTPISFRITQITGIDDQMVASAPSLTEVLPRLKELLFNAPATFVGHNVNFDLGFLSVALGAQFKQEQIDTLDLGRWTYPLARSHSLKNLTNVTQIVQETRHRALDDALATASLFLHCRQKLRDFPLELLQQMVELAQEGGWQYSGFWQELLREHIRVFPDTSLGGEPESSHSPADGLFAAEVKQKPSPELPFDIADITGMFGADGVLSESISGFEYRPQQVEMARGVCQAFSSDSHLLMEAGTGTGKSLSYLIPAIYWALSSCKKVVVATHTINLQAQLWEKDIPFLVQALPVEFKAALVKGRNNYICLRRWNTFLAKRLAMVPEEAFFTAKILTWLTQTNTGDRGEINLYGKDQELWTAINTERDLCLGPQCKYFSNKCFSMKVRREAEAANLIIANHSLVFSDIKTENKVLPAYNYLVLDEAHRIEDEATEHLGLSVSTGSLYRFLNSLNRSVGGGSGVNGGILGGLNQRLVNYQGVLSQEDYKKFSEYIGQACELVQGVREELGLFSELLGRLMDESVSAEPGEGNYNNTLRLRPDQQQTSLWTALEPVKSNLVLRLKLLGEVLSKSGNLLERSSAWENSFAQEDLRNVIAQGLAAAEYAVATEYIMALGDENSVCWLEREARGDWTNYQLKCAPVQVGPVLFQKLFSEKKSVILTSATLTVDGDFRHYMERVGLDLHPPEKTLSMIVDSPFAYELQSLLCICRDLPIPQDGEFSEAIVPFIRDLVLITGGKTLVLFTSHKMLREVYYDLVSQLESHGIRVLGHGIDGSRARLIEEFRDNPHSVLFGANSFWEGVDLPGDVLRSVIIVKIPFMPPGIPITQARLEYLENLSKDSFNRLSLPQAVLRLKQGFGRLIRTRQDHGAVIVLDNRLINKRYGSKFLRSLPVKNHFRGEKDQVLQKVSDWLHQKSFEENPFQLNPKVVE